MLVLSFLVSLGPLVLSALPVVAQGGFGVFPTTLNFKDTVRGSEYFQSIGIINSSDSDRSFSLEADGEISQWVSFVANQDRTSSLKSITTPGNSEGRALVRLQVPEDAANGSYRGVARIIRMSQQSSQEGTGSSIRVGAEIDITVKVIGTEEISGSLVEVTVMDIELGSALRLNTIVHNSGNVRAKPEITLEILDDEGSVEGQVKFPHEQVIFSNEVGEVAHTWDAASLEVGDYVARVSVAFEELDLGTREVKFSILPPGTLTRKGELKRLVLEIAPDPGGLAKFKAFFLNTGEIDTRAKFIGELLQGERLINVVTSEEILVPIGEQAALDVFVRVGDGGEYTLRGKTNYEGKETEVKELNFTVPSQAVNTSQAPQTAALGASRAIVSRASSEAAPEATQPNVSEASQSAEAETLQAIASDTAGIEDGGPGIWLWVIISVGLVLGPVVIVTVGRRAISKLQE